MNKTFIVLFAALCWAITSPAFAQAPGTPAAPPTCDVTEVQKCRDLSADCPEVCKDSTPPPPVTAVPKRPPPTMVCGQGTTKVPTGKWSYDCTCNETDDIKVRYRDYVRNEVEVSCVASSQKLRLLIDLQNGYQGQIDEIKASMVTKEELDAALKELGGQLSGLQAQIDELRPRLQAVEEEVVEHKQRLDKHDDDIARLTKAIAYNRVELLVGLGAELGSRDAQGFTGRGQAAVELTARFGEVAGACLGGAFGVGSGQTVDLLLSADVHAGPCFFFAENHRLSVAPYLQHYWQDTSTRDRNGLGNDLGFAVGGRLGYGYRFSGAPIELNPYLKLGGGPNAGINPASGESVISSGVQFAAGFQVNLVSGFLEASGE